MAGITLVQAQSQLAAYIAAETAVLSGQEYEIAGRRMRRADLKAVRDGITYWQQKVDELEAKSVGRRRSIVPRPVW